MTDRITDEMVEAAARAMAFDDNTYDPDDVIDLVPGAVVNGKTDEVIFWEVFASKARAALSASLPLMDGWQPIKTAPKDGVPVLVYGGCEGWSGRGMLCAAYYFGHWRIYGIINGMPSSASKKSTQFFSAIEPTHWMPLPPAPKGD
jgi:hypothetical protein